MSRLGKYIHSFFLAFAASLGVLTGVSFMIVATLWMAGYHLRQQPTADQLYGCSVAQQAPNGECK